MYYCAFGDFDDQDSEITVIPLEANEENRLIPIDIESDPRAEELKEIFEDWQDQVSGDMAEEEEQYPGE